MIAVSFLKSKYDRLTTIQNIDRSIADLIHVDLMDGLYVPENNFTIDSIINDLKDTTKPLDIHLMVNNPEFYIPSLAQLKPSIITIHLNSTHNFDNVLSMIKDYNIKVGIALNPDEDVHLLDNYFDLIDYVLIMSVYPGKGGQAFIKEVLNKVDCLKSKNILIGIDGGINDTTIDYIKELDIDIIVSGSYICLSDDYNKQISVLKREK